MAAAAFPRRKIPLLPGPTESEPRAYSSHRSNPSVINLGSFPEIEHYIFV